LQQLLEHSKAETNDNDQTNNISERVPDLTSEAGLMRNSSANGTAEEVQLNEPLGPRT